MSRALKYCEGVWAAWNNYPNDFQEWFLFCFRGKRLYVYNPSWHQLSSLGFSISRRIWRLSFLGLRGGGVGGLSRRGLEEVGASMLDLPCQQFEQRRRRRRELLPSFLLLKVTFLSTLSPPVPCLPRAVLCIAHNHYHCIPDKSERKSENFQIVYD